MQTALALEQVSSLPTDQPILNHPIEHFRQCKAMFANILVIHARQYITHSVGIYEQRSQSPTENRQFETASFERSTA